MHHYPFHIKDYAADTAHLTNEEDLAYRRLLDLYYDTEAPIPLETNSVSRRLRVGFESVVSVLQEFFIQHEDGWHHARCDEVIIKYQANSEQARINGKAGGRPKKTKREPDGNRIGSEKKADRKLTKNQEPLVNSPNGELTGGAQKFDPLAIQIPGCAKWGEWVEYRKGRRLTVNEKTMNKQADFLATCENPDAVIDQSIKNGWQGVFVLKGNSNGKAGSGGATIATLTGAGRPSQVIEGSAERVG